MLGSDIGRMGAEEAGSGEVSHWRMWRPAHVGLLNFMQQNRRSREEQIGKEGITGAIKLDRGELNQPSSYMDHHEQQADNSSGGKSEEHLGMGP